MNKSNLVHAIYAVLMQLPFGLNGYWWTGAAFSIAFFLGREVAQYEYKIGDPSKLKPWEGFQVWKWSKDAQLDFVLPTVVVLTIAAGQF